MYSSEDTFVIVVVVIIIIVIFVKYVCNHQVIML